MEKCGTRFTDKALVRGHYRMLRWGHQGNSSVGSLLYKQEKLSSTSAPQGKQDAAVHACKPNMQEVDTGESLEPGD